MAQDTGRHERRRRWRVAGSRGERRWAWWREAMQAHTVLGLLGERHESGPGEL